MEITGLKGKKALVTGGSHGIGKAIADALEAEGVEVTRCDRTHGYDVLKEEDLQRMGKIAEECDILINNVGGGGTWKLADWYDVWQKNFMTTFLLTVAFLGKKKEWGRVVTTSSIYGKEAGGTPAFNTSKAAQIALMKNMAGKHDGITFNTICPGFTDVGKPFPEGTIPPKYLGKPEDIAPMVVFLCSDLAKHINGANIVIDGGLSRSY